MARIADRRVCRLEMVQGHHMVVVVGAFAHLVHRGLLDVRAYHRFRFRLDLQQ